MAAKEKKTWIHNFLRLYRRVIMYVLVALLLLNMFIFYFERNFVEKAQDEYASLCNAAQTECDTESANTQISRMTQTLQINSAAIRFRIRALEYGKTSFTDETLSEFSQSFGSGKTFYFFSNGEIFSYPKGHTCPLTEEQRSQLVQKGIMRLGDYAYCGAAMHNGTLVMQMSVESAANAPSLAAFYSCDILTYDTETGEIVDVYGGELESELLGKNFNEIAFYPEIGKKVVSEEGYELLIFAPEKGILSGLTTMSVGVRCDENLSDGLQKVFYLPISYITSSTLRMIAVPMLMMLLFAVISVHSSIYYRKRWKESRIKGKEIRLGKRIRCDTAMAKNKLFVEGCFFALVLVIGLFIQSLANFANLYGDAQIHLEGLIATLEQNQKVSDYVQGQFEEALRQNTDSVVNYLSRETDSEKIESYLQQIKTIIGAEEISVYDENGVIQYSTSSYEGYQLSKMEQDSEYRLWELINGESDSLLYKLDSESGLYCCAERRQDCIGIVAVEQTDYQIRSIKEKIDVNQTAVNTDFETSDKLFVSSEDSNVLYRIRSGEKVAETLSNHLPVLEDLQEITAFTLMERNVYFVCGQGYAGASIYNADPVQPIISNALEMGWGMLIVCTAISFCVLLGTCIYTKDTLLWIKENIHMTKKELAKVQRGSLYSGWVASVFLVGLFLAADYFLSDESILSLLMFGNWQKGWNIFAFAMSVLALAAAILLNRFLRSFFRTLCKSLSSYSVTICELLRSVLTVLIYIWVVMYTLIQFGIDAKTILAGIGVSGIVISFAAKGTIEDLLSGFFLILDGRTRVGDFIKVGSYEGEITHIGVRTTKIQRWNVETSINNSDMRNIVNCSRGEFVASVDFTVPFGTDLARLKKIIEDNANRFMEKGDGILLKPPLFSGSPGFRFHGIRIRLLVPTSPDSEGAAQRKVYLELVEILKENGIAVRG